MNPLLLTLWLCNLECGLKDDLKGLELILKPSTLEMEFIRSVVTGAGTASEAGCLERKRPVRKIMWSRHLPRGYGSQAIH
jgi:hypothetical protein